MNERKGTRPRLVLCSGAIQPQTAPPERAITLQLDALDPNGNCHLRLDDVTRPFESLLNQRYFDLLEIATYAYSADCATSREADWIGDAIEPWPRVFHFVIPIRDYEFWNRSDVKNSLERALAFLTSDTFVFDFPKLAHNRHLMGYLGIDPDASAPFDYIDRVTLFSGGLDSLAGVVDTASRSENLLLVSHRPAEEANKRQLALTAKIRSQYQASLQHVPIWVNKKGLGSEHSQRTRSFLFAALAAAVGSTVEAGGIRFCENGVVSINLPFGDQVLQSRASRTTHPFGLYLLQDLCRLVTDNDDYIVENPYTFKTKEEMLHVIANAGASELIKLTCSCTHTWFRSAGKRHCGQCSQCIDRRAAVVAAHLDAFDPIDDYLSDVFIGKREPKEGYSYDHDVASIFSNFAYSMNRLAPTDIAKKYNLELVRAARPFPDRVAATQQFVDMLKHHGNSFVRAVEMQLQAHSTLIAERRLEPTSLLAMILTPVQYTAARSLPTSVLECTQQVRPAHTVEEQSNASNATECTSEATTRPDTCEAGLIVNSSDYRVVTRLKDKRTFKLSPRRAPIIKRLHSAAMSGTKEQSGDVLLEGTGTDKMSDLFKGSDAWNVLIVGNGRGIYWLDL